MVLSLAVQLDKRFSKKKQPTPFPLPKGMGKFSPFLSGKGFRVRYMLLF
jgi:hypothetical protein